LIEKYYAGGELLCCRLHATGIIESKKVVALTAIPITNNLPEQILLQEGMN
jgi:hypothetical protein